MAEQLIGALLGEPPFSLGTTPGAWRRSALSPPIQLSGKPRWRRGRAVATRRCRAGSGMLCADRCRRRSQAGVLL